MVNIWSEWQLLTADFITCLIRPVLCKTINIQHCDFPFCLQAMKIIEKGDSICWSTKTQVCYWDFLSSAFDLQYPFYWHFSDIHLTFQCKTKQKKPWGLVMSVKKADFITQSNLVTAANKQPNTQRGSGRERAKCYQPQIHPFYGWLIQGDSLTLSVCDLHSCINTTSLSVTLALSHAALWALSGGCLRRRAGEWAGGRRAAVLHLCVQPPLAGTGSQIIAWARLMLPDKWGLNIDPRELSHPDTEQPHSLSLSPSLSLSLSHS